MAQFSLSPSLCTFDSPALTSQVGGAQPSFGFLSNNANFFGIPASFTRYGFLCYTDNEPSGATSFQPLIVSGTYTQTCDFAGGVNSLYCPELHDAAFPTGTHTLTYTASAGFVPFYPTTFIIANRASQPTAYVTLTSKSTAPASPAPTTTVVVPSTTVTSTTNVALTQVATVQQTTTVTSCATTSTWPSISPIPTTTGISCPGSNGQIYQGFIIECYIDRFNNDLGNTPSTSLSDCINQCINTSGCVDVSWEPNVCYMKKNIGAVQTNSAVWGARNIYALSTTTSASPSATTLACSQNNGQYVTANSGKVFQVECGIDHANYDMPGNPVTVSNLNQCINACDSTQGCVDVSLSGVACYLKSGIGAASNNSVILGAKLISVLANGIQVSGGASARAPLGPSGGAFVGASSRASVGTMRHKRSAAAASVIVSGSPPVQVVPQAQCTWCSGWSGPDTTFGWLPTTSITTTQFSTITPGPSSTITTTLSQGTAVYSTTVTYTVQQTTTVVWTSSTCSPPQMLTVTYTNRATTTQTAPVGFPRWGGNTGTTLVMTNFVVGTSTVA